MSRPTFLGGGAMPMLGHDLPSFESLQSTLWWLILQRDASVKLVSQNIASNLSPFRTYEGITMKNEQGIMSWDKWKPYARWSWYLHMTAGVVPWCRFSPWRLFSCSTDTPTAWTESVLLSPSTEFYALHQAHILHRFFMGHCTHQLNFGASPLIPCLGQSTVGLATPLVQELWEHFIIQDGVRLRPLHLHHACININFCSQDSSRLPSSHGYSDLYAHSTTPTDSLPIDLRFLPRTITHF